ncbi:hypothetical protein, conserved, partial [Eimeria necatrix]
PAARSGAPGKLDSSGRAAAAGLGPGVRMADLVAAKVYMSQHSALCGVASESQQLCEAQLQPLSSTLNELPRGPSRPLDPLPERGG